MLKVTSNNVVFLHINTKPSMPFLAAEHPFWVGMRYVVTIAACRRFPITRVDIAIVLNAKRRSNYAGLMSAKQNCCRRTISTLYSHYLMR